MPYRKRTFRKNKRNQRQNVKRNTSSMRKYGENSRQRPRMILNTIQPANYVAQSVTIRHTYDNTFLLSGMQFTKNTQENHHINFLPNSLLIFNNGGANTGLFKYGKPVVDTFLDNGTTTDLDHTLAGAGWANKYKNAQVMVTHYNFNIRQLNNTSSAGVEPSQKIQPVMITFNRAHQAASVLNSTKPEDLQKLSFTQTRYLGKGRSSNDGVVNIKCAHYPSRFNGQQKNFLNNPSYTITPGNAVSTSSRMLPGEKDFATLAFSLPSSSLHEDVTGKIPIAGDILVRMRVSATVRYSEPANGTNQPIPDNAPVIQNSN